jgi:hypothetical protein
MTHGYILKTNADFFKAILFKHIISITQGDEHIGSGRILTQSNHSVKTIDASYYKHSCVFTVCT